MRPLLALLTVLVLPSVLKAAPAALPQIVNVSSYDPKEKQRAGRSYSEHDVSALRDNGASGLIARAGKGGNLDEKCASFVASAEKGCGGAPKTRGNCWRGQGVAGAEAWEWAASSDRRNGVLAIPWAVSAAQGPAKRHLLWGGLGG
jgi:hypothetical protein